VIADVDASLKKLLSGAIEDEKAVISFDAPTEEWANKLKAPVVNLFLYDIQEDLDGRKADWDDIRDERGRVIARQPPPRRYRLTYFVSAWASTAEEQHHLLSEILRTVPQREIVPYECLHGTLAEQEMPVVLQVGVPGQGAGASAPQMWDALGIPPRAAVELVVIAPLKPAADTDIAPAADTMSLGISRERGGPRMRPPTGTLEERAAAEAAAAEEEKKGKGKAKDQGEGEDALAERQKRWAGFRISERHDQGR
jgi:hypothetical protein